MKTLDHHLDAFIFAGRNESDCCSLVDCFELVCHELGIPTADEKSVGPVTVLVFIGLEIDSINMTIRIPEQKILELTVLLHDYLGNKKVTLRELQALTGKLMFF